MNAYVRKEICLLLPSFLVALGLALCVWFIPEDSQSHSGLRLLLAALPIVFCPALAIMMALDSFGREVSSSTFSHLLAQPMSRERIWWTKTVLLAVALLTLFGVWWLCFLLHLQPSLAASGRELRETLIVTVMILISVYAGGLWTVLLLRQVGAAFWMTILVPAGLAMSSGALADKLTDGAHTEAWVIGALGCYSVAGFWWARRLFQRAQDVQWTGGEIMLPGWFKLPRRLAAPAQPAGCRPWRALFWKEIQLHQAQFVIAAVLAASHVAVLAARRATVNLKDYWGWELVSQQFWLLWMVLPLLIGCAAVAEERKLGTWETQLGLPVPRRRQFLVKFGIALGLALLFGAALPILLEGERILPNVSDSLHQLQSGSFEFSVTGLIVGRIVNALVSQPLLPTLPFILVAGGFVSLAFYASSLVRNTLQAIAPAIAAILLAWVFLFGASFIEDLTRFPLWRGWLIHLIGLPALTVTLGGLTYGNFKRGSVGWPVWRHNLAVLGTTLALVGLLTTAIYQRAWEWLTPLEPAHGPARLQSADIVSFENKGFGLAMQFADGRSWAREYYATDQTLPNALLNNYRIKIFGGSGFLAGSNWQSVAHCLRDVVAVQRDGTLWVSEKPSPPPPINHDTQLFTQELPILVRCGNDSDWKTVFGRWSLAYALKKDGTLWRLGTKQFNAKREWPGLRSFAPVRLGAESDWAEISALSDRMLLRKEDGRLYVHPPMTASPNETLELDADTKLERVVNLEQRRWRDVVWTTTRYVGTFQAGLGAEGTFCVSGEYVVTTNGRLEIVARSIPLGTATNWIAIAANYGPVVTLKDDGTLWRWDFPDNPLRLPTTATARRLGQHDDWVAIEAVGDGIVSLAADGSLWLWRFPHSYPSGEFQVLLRPSHRPRLVGNVFAVGKN